MPHPRVPTLVCPMPTKLMLALPSLQLFQAVGFRRAMTVAKFLELEPESGDEWAYNRYVA